MTAGTQDLRQAVEAVTRTLRDRDLPALAAPVAGIDRRILALRPPAGEGDPWILLDPVITSVARERESDTETCLCLPGFRIRVPRPRQLMIRARTLEGRPIRFAAGGELARALLHQVDHLEGVLPAERMTSEAREELPESMIHPPSHCAPDSRA